MAGSGRCTECGKRLWFCQECGHLACPCSPCSACSGRGGWPWRTRWCSAASWSGPTCSGDTVSTWYSRNRHRYGEAWPAIAHAVKTDAGWQCEACGAPHGPPPRVLTVDHLDHVPENMERENLVALCQRCHLRRQGLRPRPRDKAEALERLRRYQENEDAQGGLFDG